MGVETPARWAPDPSGRHRHRFWNGTTWTDFVADQGSPFLDPGSESVPVRAAAPVPAPATAHSSVPASAPAPSFGLGARPGPPPVRRKPPVVAPRTAPEGAPAATKAEPAAEPRPSRGPNRLPSHRERRNGRRRAAVGGGLAIAGLVAVVLAAGRDHENPGPASPGTPTTRPAATSPVARPSGVTRAASAGKEPLVAGAAATARLHRKVGRDARLANCAAVRKAGLGPYLKIRDGEYAWYPDPDEDGIACE